MIKEILYKLLDADVRITIVNRGNRTLFAKVHRICGTSGKFAATTKTDGVILLDEISKVVLRTDVIPEIFVRI